MTIRHHPDEPMLVAFAAGTLDLGQHVAIATHLVSCASCRGFAHAMEHVGGTVVINLPPAPMAANALAEVEARIAQPQNADDLDDAAHEIGVAADVAGLPKFLRRYRFGDWRWIAPRVHLRRIDLPWPSATRVFLLRSGPGTKMLPHSHTGIEMTCVLAGAFRHTGGHFGPGDFDLGDETVDHQPVVDAGADCLCLVAMQGELRLKGAIGRLVQPFIHL
jgi:putative transcriptional regulator